MAKAAEGAV